MIITIDEARKLMGESNNKYSDQQLEEIILLLTYIADLIIDQYLANKNIKGVKNNGNSKNVA